MFGSEDFTELILVVLIFAGLVGVVSLFLRKSDKAQGPILGQRPSIGRSESPSTASSVTQGEVRTKGPHEKFCKECGSVIRAKAEICPKCGVRQAIGLSAGRNRVAAALLALILGGFGIHKFYLGKVGQGVLYLLFCWTLIPLVISLIEGIEYLTMTDGEFAAKYG